MLLFRRWIIHILTIHVLLMAPVITFTQDESNFNAEGQTSTEKPTDTRNVEIVSTNTTATRNIMNNQQMEPITSSAQVQTILITPTQTTASKDKPASPAMKLRPSFISILTTGGAITISQIQVSSTADNELSSTSVTQALRKAIIVKPTTSVVTTKMDNETSIKPTRAISSSTAMLTTPTPFSTATKTNVLKMKHSSTLEPHSIAATLKPRHSRTSILMNIPPEVRQPIKPISLIEGQVFRLKIPEETFHDKEDGGTRNLKLQLLTNERKPLPPTSWILLNQTNQELYALPTETNKESHDLIVSATDSGNLITTETLQMIIKEDLDPYNHRFTINLKLDNSIFLDHLSTRIMLLKKLAVFFAVNLTNIRVESFGAGTSLTFHFDFVPFEFCDHEPLIQLASTFIDSDKNISPSFHNSLLPQFSIISGYYKMLGSCASDVHQTSANNSQTDEEIWWLYAFIPAILLIAILVTSGVFATRGRCARKRRDLSEEERRLNVNEDETQL